MVLRTIFTLSSAILVASIGYGALNVAAPEAASKIENVFRDYGMGWTDAACERNPDGCLNSRFERLSILEKQVSASTDAIGSERSRINSLVAEQEELVGKNAMFLDQGRTIYRQRLGMPGQPAQPDTPITFAGRTYPNLATFKSQLQLLFEEKSALEKSLASARELGGKLQSRLDTLMVQSGQIALAKRIIPAQLQLVRANQTLGEFSANMDMIDGVIRGSEAGLSQSEQLIRTTRDLMLPPASDGHAGVALDAFENYLKN